MPVPIFLKKLLDEHLEVDFVQLQINYADWENPSVASRANYEAAHRHGKPITVMEPAKGGMLANPPQVVKNLFKAHHSDMSCASWAIRIVASLEGIVTDEQKIILQAQRILYHSSIIVCMGCGYCLKGCPRQINIHGIFKAMNKQLGNGLAQEASESYFKAAPECHRAFDCIGCRSCERSCPQHLEIIKNLEKA